MTGRQLDEEAIFHIARRIEDPELRTDYLQQACGDDTALLARVGALLDVHEQEQAFLRSAPAEPEPTIDAAPISESPGTEIGPYRLMEQIGEGGMGVVFVAEQRKPLRRKVALKVIKPGMDSKAVIARFEAERQALALMDHPNIAKVLDAGTTESGRPYFAMELVKGVPITEYCDQNRLSIRERLRLFIQVCQAIQHAHQKGIIHRDIKPSNVLVTLHDGKPVPKVIDFGVAKALNTRLTDKTIYTEHLQIIGTLLYMSPEQAELSGLDMDTRSDVYSLGVLLYELLTGTTPFQKAELDEAAFDERRRIIREQVPQKASNRISSLGDTTTLVAEHRKTDPKKLHQLVRGDLDWIVMKSLEKDRTRRYDTAAAFAVDVQRHIDDGPIEARPPSGLYQLRKFYDRNKTLTWSAIAVFLALAIGLVGALWGVAQATSKNAELVKALREWRLELIDRGLESAMRGDLEAVREVLEKANRAGAPRDWCLLLEGLANNFGDDAVAAGRLIKEALLENPDNLAVAASLMMTRNSGRAWNQSDYEELMIRLQGKTPSGEFQEFERLLLGWSQMYVDPEKSMRMIEKAIESRSRPWPIAQVFLAQAEAHVAVDRGDLQLALQSVERATDADRRLEENGLSKATNAWTRIVAMQLSTGVDESQSAELRQECKMIVDSLRGYPNAFAVPLLRGIFCELTDDPETEEVLLEGKNDDWWGACRAGYFYRIGRMDVATDGLPRDVQEMPLAATARFAILAAHGRNTEAMEGYERLLDAHSSSFVHAFAMQIPLIAGRLDIASQDARRCLKKGHVPDQPFYRARTRLEYYADDLSNHQILERVQGSRLGECYAHYAIALKHLHNHPGRAREHFEKCLKTGQFWTPEYYMSKAFLAQLSALRMEGP